MEILTSEEMMKADEYAIEYLGVPGMVLMENAARRVFEEIVEAWTHDTGRSKLF